MRRWRLRCEDREVGQREMKLKGSQPEGQVTYVLGTHLESQRPLTSMGTELAEQ